MYDLDARSLRPFKPLPARPTRQPRPDLTVTRPFNPCTHAMPVVTPAAVIRWPTGRFSVMGSLRCPFCHTDLQALNS